MIHDTDPERFGLFTARVPRYTSYPPANHFEAGLGAVHQADWLAAIPEGEAISLYIHIPFCKRLCWFCACHTQGTQTLRPVEAYIDTLLREIAMVRAALAPSVHLSRLHLGGGTPTILSPALMERLIGAVFDAFARADDFEFSVEIDPTEAAPALLRRLGQLGMNRASIGVQDFEPKVQEAIGRLQSYAETRAAIDVLRGTGVGSLNMDLLYGLPHQSLATLGTTLDQVLGLAPDRVALYGYAHVPWMSKRQVLIDEDALPGPKDRFAMAEYAKTRFVAAGYVPIGIDHFARPEDGLAQALAAGRLRRNFQGYTDDPARTLVGLGASAVSQYAQGFCQNAAPTRAWTERIEANELAGHRGYVLSAADRLVARMIEELMCTGRLDAAALGAEFPDQTAKIHSDVNQLTQQFNGVVQLEGGLLQVAPAHFALLRLMAAALDPREAKAQAHSVAI